MPEETKVESGFAFHCHHDKLVEWVTNYDLRVEYIINNKPVGEQELRLRLFQMIPANKLSGVLAELLEARNKADEAYIKASEARGNTYQTQDSVLKTRHEVSEIRDKASVVNDKAWEVCHETRRFYIKAVEDCDQLWETCQPEFVKLHEELCPDCPWDGETIFPARRTS